MVWLLTGCSTQVGPPSPTSTTTATPASSAPVPAPSSTGPGAYKPADANGKAQNVPVPVMPELAKENSKAGLEAFIGYYYAIKNYANETGDTTVLATLNSSDCASCTKLLDATSDSYIDGRWRAGGNIRIPVVEIDWKDTDSSHLAKLQLIQDAIAYYNADGTEGRPANSATNSAFVLIAAFEASWKVVEIGVLR
ncbi:DUF6318 family protein [Arthrobacter sp. fls2-241-R2A-172]|uniref:DUF6318 family protein n=1 Tax=Arthrobacter sp. fls2-241-R2A-172 TaxID=3040325 RepID=UPI00254BE750|nr:DUF6318 family protein [Arthrobacter sp. fls2-241-R2A-172]